VDTLILRECKRGSFSIAREWTDWANPSWYDSLGFQPQRLDADSLFELVALLEGMTKPKQKIRQKNSWVNAGSGSLPSE
jgi:hypothetical protein